MSVLRELQLSAGRFARAGAWLPALALAAVCLLAPFFGFGSSSSEPSDEPSETATTEQQGQLPRPIEMRNFVTYIAKESELQEEVHAQVAYLYQPLNIAHLIRIHVEFLEEGSPERDTLDAPEGYLYLSDMELTEEHPFFKRIGGHDAITTATFGKEEKVETIRRGEKDIDVFGRLSRRVVYRDRDGTVVNSSRVYRCASESRLYGLGDVEMVRPRATKSDEWVFTGQMFTVDDKLTSKIVVRGKLGSPPRFSVRPLGK